MTGDDASNQEYKTSKAVANKNPKAVEQVAEPAKAQAAEPTKAVEKAAEGAKEQRKNAVNVLKEMLLAKNQSDAAKLKKQADDIIEEANKLLAIVGVAKDESALAANAAIDADAALTAANQAIVLFNNKPK